MVKLLAKRIIFTAVLAMVFVPFFGNAQSAYPQPQLGQETGLYRLYNLETNNHLYTVDYNEAFALKNSGAYVLEGTVGNVFVNQTAGSVPLHRLYNSRLDKHAFVLGTNGLSTLKRSGYKEEAVIAYIVNDMSVRSTINGSSPNLYWLQNAKAKDYLLTSDFGEVAGAQSNGYKLMPGTFYIF